MCCVSDCCGVVGDAVGLVMGAENDLTQRERDRFHADLPRPRQPKCPLIAKHIQLVIEDESNFDDAMWPELSEAELHEVICDVTRDVATFAKDRLAREHKRLEG